MSSLISSMLESLFPKSDFRCLMIGLDASGKTSILYKLKLGELVTTIPTIGFNVETIRVNNVDFTVWDVGGCDKIRPLFRHYYQNTQALIFVVDCNDKERIDETRDFFFTTLADKQLEDAVVLLFLNKLDLPNCLPIPEVLDQLAYESLRRKSVTEERLIHVQPCCAVTGAGLHEGMAWLEQTMLGRKTVVEQPTLESLEKQEQHRMEEMMLEWLSREDEEDDLFLQKLKDFTLETWDHRTHLRIAWLLLQRHGRQKGLPLIFQLIRSFIENSPRTKRGSAETRGTTFHETMTYFWVHMVHYAIEATKLPKNDFKTFLLMNPQLSNGGLFLHYYSKQRMLQDPDARSVVLLPDKVAFPSLLVDLSKQPSTSISQEYSNIQPRVPLTDGEFLQLLESVDGLQKLPSWGHEWRLRLVYLMLCRWGRVKGGADRVLAMLEKVEKEHHHVSLSFFWIQLVSYHIACEMLNNTDAKFGVFGEAAGNLGASVTVEKVYSETLDGLDIMPFKEFLQRPHCQALRNEFLYEKYYTRKTIDKEVAAKELTLPDIKQFPSVALKL